MLPFTSTADWTTIFICELAVTHGSFEIGYRFEAAIYKKYKYTNDGTKSQDAYHYNKVHLL